jgi:hypothetical protein
LVITLEEFESAAEELGAGTLEETFDENLGSELPTPEAEGRT